ALRLYHALGDLCAQPGHRHALFGPRGAGRFTRSLLFRLRFRVARRHVLVTVALQVLHDVGFRDAAIATTSRHDGRFEVVLVQQTAYRGAQLVRTVAAGFGTSAGFRLNLTVFVFLLRRGFGMLRCLAGRRLVGRSLFLLVGTITGSGRVALTFFQYGEHI